MQNMILKNAHHHYYLKPKLEKSTNTHLYIILPIVGKCNAVCPKSVELSYLFNI